MIVLGMKGIVTDTESLEELQKSPEQVMVCHGADVLFVSTTSVQGGQKKKKTDPLELDLGSCEPFRSGLRTNLGSFGRVSSALNCSANSPSLHMDIYFKMAF